MALFWSKKSKAEKIYDKALPAGRQVQAPAKKSTPVKGAKTAKVVKAPKVAANAGAVAAVGSFGSATDSIIRPHITEKSGVLSQGGVYTFEVTKSATKHTVAQAVKTMYKVTPIKVSMVNIPAKNIFVKGRWGTVSAMKKALVKVKAGDKIDFA